MPVFSEGDGATADSTALFATATHFFRLIDYISRLKPWVLLCRVGTQRPTLSTFHSASAIAAVLVASQNTTAPSPLLLVANLAHNVDATDPAGCC